MSAKSIKSFSIKECDNKKRLDQFITEQNTELSRSKIQKLIDCNKIICDNKQDLKSSCVVKTGEVYHVVSEELDILKTQKPYKIDIEIHYEDKNIVVVNKPAGLVTHPGIGNKDNTLANALVAHFGQESLSNVSSVRPGIVHRLDKETCGFLIIAKNDKVHAKLCQMIKDRQVERMYIAIVHNKPKSDFDTISTLIKRKRSVKQKMVVCNTGGKTAITHYKTLEYNPKHNISIVECKLETGRTHQIRVHMEHIGCPIVGDKLYGANKIKDAKIKNHGLFAYKIKFDHPETQKKMLFTLDAKKLTTEFIVALLQDRTQEHDTQQAPQKAKII